MTFRGGFSKLLFKVFLDIFGDLRKSIRERLFFSVKLLIRFFVTHLT